MKPHTTQRSWRVLAAAVFTLSVFITPSHAQERDRKVLFIGGAGEPTQATDGDVMTHLQERYGENNVSYSSGDDSSPGDANSVDLIIISSTLGSGSVRGKFHRSPTPVLNWEEALVDQGRAGNWPFTEGARTKSTEETLVVVNADHPIAAHLGLTEGPLKVFVEDGGKTWSAAGPLPGEAFIIMDTQSSFDLEPETSGAAVFGIDKGGKLFDDADGVGYTALAKSIHYAMEDDSPGAFTEVGWELFDACLDWLTDDLTDGSDPDVAVLETISFDLVPDDADQTLEVKIRSANTEATKALELSDFALSGENADQFSLIEPFPSSIEAGGEAILKVGFNNERKLGTFTATLTFTTNDPDADDGTVTATLVAKVPNPDGPIAHYRLDEADGSVAGDSTTNDNTAAYNGNVTLGEPGLKEGTGTSMTVAAGGQLVLEGGLPLNGSFSIALWLNASVVGDGLQTIIGQGETTPNVALLLAGGDLQWFGGEDAILIFSETKPIAAETTYHVAMTYDSATGMGTVFVDGAQVASGDVGEIQQGGGFYAGTFGDGTLPPAEGSLDDIQIYDRILTVDDELTWLIENPGGVLNPYRGDGPVVEPGESGDITNVARSEAGNVGFDLPDGSYDVEYSEDLDNWSVIATGVSGAYEDTDAARSAREAGYYRGVLKE